MSATIKPKYLPQIEQGENDYRTYRPLILPTASGEDGITILLVNDPQSKHFAGMSLILSLSIVRFMIATYFSNTLSFAASVSVGSGASSDPRALPGLAHFCEHSEFQCALELAHQSIVSTYHHKHSGFSVLLGVNGIPQRK